MKEIVNIFWLTPPYDVNVIGDSSLGKCWSSRDLWTKQTQEDTFLVLFFKDVSDFMNTNALYCVCSCSLSCFAPPKWWMATAWSSHWLSAAVLHTVTLVPSHVTSEHSRFIYAGLFLGCSKKEMQIFFSLFFFLPCDIWPWYDGILCQFLTSRIQKAPSLLGRIFCAVFTTVSLLCMTLIQGDLKGRVFWSTCFFPHMQQTEQRHLFRDQ